MDENDAQTEFKKLKQAAAIRQNFFYFALGGIIVALINILVAIILKGI